MMTSTKNKIAQLITIGIFSWSSWALGYEPMDADQYDAQQEAADYNNSGGTYEGTQTEQDFNDRNGTTTSDSSSSNPGGGYSGGTSGDNGYDGGGANGGDPSQQITQQMIDDGYIPGYGYVGFADDDIDNHMAAGSAGTAKVAKDCPGCDPSSPEHFEAFNEGYFNGLRDSYEDEGLNPMKQDLAVGPMQLRDKMNDVNWPNEITFGEVSDQVKKQIDNRVAQGKATTILPSQVGKVNAGAPSGLVHLGSKHTYIVLDTQPISGYFPDFNIPAGTGGVHSKGIVFLDTSIIPNNEINEKILHETVHAAQEFLIAEWNEISQQQNIDDPEELSDPVLKEGFKAVQVFNTAGQNSITGYNLPDNRIGNYLNTIYEVLAYDVEPNSVGVNSWAGNLVDSFKDVGFNISQQDSRILANDVFSDPDIQKLKADLDNLIEQEYQ